jgi:beta-lactam-binding protein with PASTA domain
MATVYLATDLRLERRVAIKVMHGHLADDASFRDRFIQEARSAARLAHPNVVNVFDQGQDSDMAYLVMEYLQGITLRDLLKEYGKLTPEQTMDIMEAVLAGLAAAHKAGIVHRDLKPENVLLADDGRIKIGDFGLARAATANTATGQALLGTIAYLSPELVTRGIADARSDIYALGIMMYEMLVGDQPFKGDQPVQIAYQHANDQVPAPSTKNPAVPIALDELVLWATARDPEQRPRDARAMLDQLFETQNLIREGLGGVSTATQRTMVMPATTPGSGVHESGETQVLSRARRTGPVALETATKLSIAAQRRRRRGFWMLGFVLVLLAAAGGTGWYFGSGPGAQTSIPSVAGKSVDDATRILRTAGFTVGTKNEVFDWKTDPGLISSTRPRAGADVVRDTPITLNVSKGAQPLEVPKLAGLSAADAHTAITDARFVLGVDPQPQFSADVPKGVVLRALGKNGAVLDESASYPEHQPIALVLSAGRMPVVDNIPVAQAEAALRAAGLEPVRGNAEFDNSGTYPADNVKKLDPVLDSKGAVRPYVVGDKVTIHLSKGKDLVSIPDVVGVGWTKAKQILIDAGVVPTYNQSADTLPAVFQVAGVNPAPGTQVVRGSSVAVQLTATL